MTGKQFIDDKGFSRPFNRDVSFYVKDGGCTEWATPVDKPRRYITHSLVRAVRINGGDGLLRGLFPLPSPNHQDYEIRELTRQFAQMQTSDGVVTYIGNSHYNDVDEFWVTLGRCSDPEVLAKLKQSAQFRELLGDSHDRLTTEQLKRFIEQEGLGYVPARLEKKFTDYDEEGGKREGREDIGLHLKPQIWAPIREALTIPRPTNADAKRIGDNLVAAVKAELPDFHVNLDWHIKE
jgi:hypothetical protein